MKADEIRFSDDLIEEWLNARFGSNNMANRQAFRDFADEVTDHTLVRLAGILAEVGMRVSEHSKDG